MAVTLSRAAYAGHYGPTVGDRIRLADTELIIEIEKDHAVYGEEVVFGGGKVIRDGMGQAPLCAPMSPPQLDLVITNVVVLDWWGIVKGDIGIGHGHLGHHLYPRRLEHHAPAPGGRGAAGQPWLPGQGQRQPARPARRTDPRRRLRSETARGLGHDTGSHRHLPGRGRPLRRPG